MRQVAVKILFLSAEADIRGGGERFLLDVITSFRSEYEVGCVCPSGGALADALRLMGVKVFVCPTGWNGKFKNWASNHLRIFHLASRVRLFAPQVVYANGGGTNNTAVRLARLLGCRSVVNVHDVFTAVSRDKYAFGRAGAAVACSVGVADMVRPFHPAVRVVYNGVDTQKYSLEGRGRARERIGVQDGQFAVGFVGTVVEKKGIVEFIDAARFIAEGIPEAIFVIAGEPKAGEEGLLVHLKKQVVTAGLEGRFRWLGFVEDLHEVMPGLDVLLFPAHYEAFGRVIIEAMACGVVPVSSLAGGPREIVEEGKTGFLRPYEDVKLLVAAVELLYRDADLRSRMSAAARASVVSRFSMASMLAGVRNAIELSMKRG